MSACPAWETISNLLIWYFSLWRRCNCWIPRKVALSRMWKQSQAWPPLSGLFLLQNSCLLKIFPGAMFAFVFFCESHVWPTAYLEETPITSHTQSPHLFACTNISPSLPLSVQGRYNKWLTQNSKGQCIIFFCVFWLNLFPIGLVFKSMRWEQVYVCAPNLRQKFLFDSEFASQILYLQ